MRLRMLAAIAMAIPSFSVQAAAQEVAAPDHAAHGAPPADHAAHRHAAVDHTAHLMHMTGALGPYAMTRDSSGTAWQPEVHADGGDPRPVRRMVDDAAWIHQSRGRRCRRSARRQQDLQPEHVHGDGASAVRRRVAHLARDGFARSDHGQGRLSAAVPDRRDGGRDNAADRPPAPARFPDGACGHLQPHDHRNELGVSLCGISRRTRARPADVHASLLRHGQSRGAARPSLAGRNAHHLRRAHRRRRVECVQARRIGVQWPRAGRAALEFRSAAIGIRRRCGSPGIRRPIGRCRRAGARSTRPKHWSRTSINSASPRR